MDAPKQKITRRIFLAFSAAAAGAAVVWRKLWSPSGEFDREPAAAADTDAIPAGAQLKYGIFPTIGIARVGSSRDEFFIGPEVTDPPPARLEDIRGKDGAIRRQAARFRIYSYYVTKQGKIKYVSEVLPNSQTEITWEVHVANKKASWYRFICALDLKEAKDLKCIRRNAKVKGKDREELEINPGPKKIDGRFGADKVLLSGGKFQGTEVLLGELRTDEKGRLLVLGGYGISDSPKNKPVFDDDDADTFNNADGWYDDIADGPVRAQLTIQGKSYPVDSAWVVTCPPNYAPDVVGWRTMYELVLDTLIATDPKEFKPTKTSFTRDVWPLLNRLTRIEWVNKGFAEAFGKSSTMHFNDPKVAAQLSSNIATMQSQRAEVLKVYESFRLQGRSGIRNPRLWPMLYGDSYGTYDKSDDANLIVPTIQAEHLKRWVDGNFTDDWAELGGKVYDSIDKVKLEDQPKMLTQAALHFCLADAFHPGCELTWPMRHASLFSKSSVFRILERKTPAKDFGEALTSKIALSADGPLTAQGPGDLTKWMAVPWQGDTLFCRSGYEPEVDPYIPSFWPARVPNQVLTENDYDIAVDPTVDRASRLAAFNRRESWVRNFTGSAPNQIKQMVQEFGRMGIITLREGVKGDANLPAEMWVESMPTSLSKGVPRSASPGGLENAVKAGPKSNEEKAGWESREQLEEFRRIRFRGRRG